jgi:hypothetical protein
MRVATQMHFIEVEGTLDLFVDPEGRPVVEVLSDCALVRLGLTPAENPITEKIAAALDNGGAVRIHMAGSGLVFVASSRGSKGDLLVLCKTKKEADHLARSIQIIE